MSDIRRIVGSVVHTKAMHVTKEAECGRRYGRNKSTKLVQGQHNGLSRTGRSQCFLTCDFDFGLGVSERKKLNTRSVKSGPPPSAANSEILAQNSEINAADATSWLQDISTSRSPRRSGTNRLCHELNRVMTITSHHENPHDNDADDDKDESSGIVSLLVACNSGFFGILYITHS
jgi:hypothetical protein